MLKKNSALVSRCCLEAGVGMIRSSYHFGLFHFLLLFCVWSCWDQAVLIAV